MRHIYDSLNKNKKEKSCHIAVLFKNKSMIYVGHNQMNRQFYNGKMITSLHAEIDCIRKIKKHRKCNKLFVVKISKKSTIDNIILYDSRPCVNCTNTLLNKGFKYVYCSDETGNIIKFILKNRKSIIL